MEKSLVIYDSVFGNTERIALAIAAGLGTQAIPVDRVNLEEWRDLDLLVVGSPTRRFSPTESAGQ